MSLIDKYIPKTYSDIKGQDKAIEKTKQFLSSFPRKKALIYYGSSGTGKTSLAYVTAKQTDSEIIELNASDLRDKEHLKSILGAATQQASLFGKKNKIILVDEIDGITREDRGGIQELSSLISETHFPIIMTANDVWDKKFSELRRKAEIIEFKKLRYDSVLNILQNIADRESLEINEDITKSIAIKSNGDVRAGINDLQTVGPDTTHKDISERDKEEKIFSVLQQVFKEMPSKSTIRLYNQVNMPLDKIFLWIEENIPNEYKGKELYKAFNCLSKADVFKGRIRRQQHWRFLVYENFLLSYGIAASKSERKTGWTSYKPPQKILQIWLANQKQKYKKSIAGKYSKLTHISKKRAIKEFLFIKQLLQKNHQVRKELDLNEKEIEFIEN